MQSVTRVGDLLVRLGGEEIAWIAALPGLPEAAGAAERMRAAIADHRVEGLPMVTVSIGVATSPAATAEPHMDSARNTGIVYKLLEEADGYLYEAKRAGRNRIVAPGGIPHPRTKITYFKTG